MGKKVRAIAKERAAAEVKGDSKKQRGVKKKQKKAADPSKKVDKSEDVGIVAKKKKRFFAVAIGMLHHSLVRAALTPS
jgi:Caulimovirus viroplasmin